MVVVVWSRGVTGSDKELVPGLYESVVTDRLSGALTSVPDELVSLDDLDPADGDVLIARHVAGVVLQLLRSVPDADRPGRQVELANAILSLIATAAAPLLGERIDPGSRVLRSIRDAAPFSPHLPRPTIPLSSSALLVNNRGEPGVGDAVRQELESADRVDLVCAFIRWTGVRIVLDAIRRVTARGGRVRILTTTYLGATERRAVDELIAAGAEVRVFYDVEATRLHAKAWLLHRDSGFSTAYVGSSNLSRAALVDGLEWNVRLSDVENPACAGRLPGHLRGLLGQRRSPGVPARRRRRAARSGLGQPARRRPARPDDRLWGRLSVRRHRARAPAPSVRDPLCPRRRAAPAQPVAQSGGGGHRHRQDGGRRPRLQAAAGRR